MQLLESKTSQDYLALASALAEEFATTAVERDRGGTPKQERDRIRQSGLLQLIVPKEYGGLGETWITTLKIGRELAKVDTKLALVSSVANKSNVTQSLRLSDAVPERPSPPCSVHNLRKCYETHAHWLCPSGYLCHHQR